MAGSMASTSTSDSRLDAYVPDLLRTWSPTGSDHRHMRVPGSLAFVDISGFTRLTERLARRGKVGAEEMSDILSATFSALLDEAVVDGADLVKWGGDAVLLLFRGTGHALRAARAAHRMRATMRRVGRIETSAGVVVLRMSIGVHSGDFDFFLVGDPEIHRELIISGPDASATAATETATPAGQIGLSAGTAALLPSRVLGAELPGSDPVAERLLRSAPEVADAVRLPRQLGHIDPAAALPPPIRAHLLDGPREPEHRAITVAFVQFSGSDDLLISQGPAALTAALDEMVRNVQHACAEHDVTFFETDINRDGGKIMLTSGAPRSADHHEERMLRACRQVLDDVGRLPLRIGINHGHVFAGDFGPEFRRTYSVKGDAVNLAARVMGRAHPGELLATAPVIAQSQTLFSTTELPPFMVKGKSRPVLAASIGRVVGTRADHGLAVELVGRDREMQELLQALGESVQGSGRLVELVGEAGVGKSRLVEELVSVARCRVLSARCEEYESSTPYFPVRKLLRDALQVPPGAGPEETGRALTACVRREAPHLEPWLPLLGVPLDVMLPSTPETEELDPEFRRTRLEQAVSELLAALLGGPTLVVVEDAHDMDAASAGLVHHLARDLTERPWLLLVTMREHPFSFVATLDEGATTVLSPLGPDAAQELVRSALADRPLPPRAMERLAARSGGNPMFLEALVRYARRADATDVLPESVEALVTSKIDRLPPVARRVLRYAAVLGTVVDEETLGMLLGGSAGGDVLVDSLGYFLVRGQSGRLRFRNALLRDVAYEGLPYRRRRQLHDQVGRALERTATDPLSRSELLSLHFFHAGRHQQAWHYSVAAGHRALAKLAPGEAADFFARAVQCVPRDGSVPAEELSEVHEHLADARYLTGLTDEATAAYAQARRQVPDDPVRQALLVEKEVRIDLRRRRFPQAMRRLTRGLHALEGIPGARADAARSLLARRYAHSRLSQGSIDEALRWAERAAHSAEESLDKRALAQAYEAFLAIHAASGRAEPLPYGRLALQANRELGDLTAQGHCLNNIAVQAYLHGRWEEALVCYREATQIFGRTGDTASEGNAAYNQAELLVRQGRFAEAGELLDEVLVIARAVEDDELVALAMREQARVVAGSGDADEAVDLLREAGRRFEELDEPDERLVTDVVLAEVLLDAERVDGCTEVLDTLPDDVDPEALPGVAPRVRRLRGRVHAVHGRSDEAVAELLAGLGLAQRDHDRYEQALLLRELVGLGVHDAGAREGLGTYTEILASLGVISAS
jgi:class 3 adenylate cyclase/tetratricopeptide (TPR) repeat protein